jgi:hypothetical protein
MKLYSFLSFRNTTENIILEPWKHFYLSKTCLPVLLFPTLNSVIISSDAVVKCSALVFLSNSKLYIQWNKKGVCKKNA